ncbi:histidine phosphatase family protein [Aquipuribacter hungaricus]|uniref:Histidine phosphatase family protein n=1 Tax=Aquipuribacter hungaricus TaxID=545624 RepID=A0ABV7WDF4_9MICO
MTARPPLVVLLRHGETGWNAEGRFQGQLDTDLSATGRGQATAAGQALAGATAGRRLLLRTSDLGRARDTAAAVTAATGVAAVPDPRLREIAAGRWQGLLHEQIAALDPEAFRAWRAGDDVVLGGGESPGRCGARVRDAVLEHAAPLADGDVLVVVGHGASTRAGVALLLGQPDLRRVLVPLGNTGTAVLSPLATGWRLLGWNVPPSALGELLDRRADPSAALA